VFGARASARSTGGARTDETLAFLRRCFDADVVKSHGQEFLFLPRPARPPIYVGGGGEHALRRVVRYADGWMPMFADPAKLAAGSARLRELAEAAGRTPPEVVAFTAFDPRALEAVADRVAELRGAGATRLVAAVRYEDADGFRSHAEFLAERVLPHLL
jgi:alkanesulfonate monooxygenase SsuD/methylene tetrahydromethanopterin reductase-like flavin-dependent oxidoreductase (luciferase family)